MFLNLLATLTLFIKLILYFKLFWETEDNPRKIKVFT